MCFPGKKSKTPAQTLPFRINRSKFKVFIFIYLFIPDEFEDTQNNPPYLSQNLSNQCQSLSSAFELDCVIGLGSSQRQLLLEVEGTGVKV
jgi:hypothetical protein